MSADIVLRAEGLGRRVSLPSGAKLDILKGAGLTVRAGESIAVQGRSGSGKSTLLSLLGLLARPDQGTIRLAGQETIDLRDAQLTNLRNSQLGFVFQNFSLVHHLNAAQNVELPLRYGAPKSRRERKKLVDEALSSVGLANRAGARPRQLSGGEQQRVALARALVARPSLLLADEPTGALDVMTATQIVDVMLGEATKRGCAIVIVTHDPEVAKRMSRMLLLDDGVLVP